jgi:hypothetical protein
MSRDRQRWLAHPEQTLDPWEAEPPHFVQSHVQRETVWSPVHPAAISSVPSCL